MITKHLWLLLVLLSTIKVYAQEKTEAQPIYTDRPGQSINPYTAGDGALQFQSGYGFFREMTASSEIDLHNFDLNTKLGVFDRLEVSMLLQASSLNVEQEDIISPFDGDNEPDNGLSAFALSARGLIMKGDGLKPAIGFEATYLASGIPGEELSNTNGRFILTLQNELLDGLSLTGNVVYFTNDRTEFTANLGYAITEKVGVFAEYWPIFEAAFDGKSGLILQDSYMNTGLFWQLGDDFMIDMAGGFRAFAPDEIDEDSESFYLQIGLTKRFWL